jgi:mono/diheme cytochrome c family protein
MNQPKVKRTFPLLLAGLLGLALVVGCRRATTVPPPVPPPAPAPPSGGPTVGTASATGPFAAARQTFDAKCAKCHAIGNSAGSVAAGPGPGGGGGPGPGGPGGGRKKGPDLAKVGADPKHTRQWFIDYIRDPKTQNSDTRMPPFGNQLNDNELGALADYLSSLKGT